MFLLRLRWNTAKVLPQALHMFYGTQAQTQTDRTQNVYYFVSVSNDFIFWYVFSVCVQFLFILTM